MNIDELLLYVSFVEDRHAVWRKRQAGEPGPWTDDPFLRDYKYTNVFRVLDYGSQFLLSELLTPDLDDRDTLARAFLYRYTNDPEAWRWVGARYGGRYPIAEDFGPGLVRVFDEWAELGQRIFSPAYVVKPPGAGRPKHELVVELAARLFTWASPDDLMPRWRDASTLAERYALLREQLYVGDFMAMQIATDYGYSVYGAGQDENSFIVAGPGARRGAAELDPVRPALEVIHRCRDFLLASPGCPTLELESNKPIDGRAPTLMDVQNTLCEFSKYMRHYRKPPPNKPYTPAHPGAQPPPVLPSHWAYEGNRT